MNKRTAKWIWNNACVEQIGPETEKHTAMGHMMMAHGLLTQPPMHLDDEWEKIASFLRQWAAAMEGVD